MGMKHPLPFIHRKQTLKRKLFVYMFMLAALLLLLFFAGILLIDGYSGTKDRLAEELDFQSDVFERQLTSHYSNLAVMGIQLSENTARYIQSYLQDNGLTFAQLEGSQTHIAGIQEGLIDPLRQKLMETACSGAFILLNTQVNPAVENAASSRSGLYLQRNSLDSTDTRVLLYRGLSDVGKNHEAMPHRKWRLEFDTRNFPDYASLISLPAGALSKSYRLTEMAILPGTSERVMLLALPIYGKDNTFYGLCGLEISESYFKHIFAQPSDLNHAIFCLSRGAEGLTDPEKSLTAGITNDYYLAPQGTFCSKPFGGGLFACESEDDKYVGTIHTVNLCPGGETYSISVLMPREDYEGLAGENTLRIALLLVVIGGLSAILCLYFSKRYLKPLTQSLRLIQQKEYATAESRLEEISDLFAFLAEQDRLQEEALAAVEAELNQIQTQRTQDKQELQRLAYARKSEVDPQDYENFRRGIEHLTATERRIFDYYLEGKSVKEIMELMGVKESTVRFHNRNIYTTLGVNSLKQLLRCAAILRQEEA